MILLEGAPALSPFRRERLQARLRTVQPDIAIAGAWHGYWVEPDAGATPDTATLRRILGQDKVEDLRIAGRYRRDVY